MSTARLNIWVTQIGKPCRIEEPFYYEDELTKSYVHVLHCDGTILEWCGRRYQQMPTDCGHLEVEVPPGCYMVCATLHEATETKEVPKYEDDEGRVRFLGNHLSHVAVVRVNCGDHACVTLFQPAFHHCLLWWVKALEEHEKRGLQVKKGTVEAVKALMKTLPPDPLTENMVKALAPAARPPRDRHT